jgi:flagellar motor switch/type III secretory pathway protein FliN
MPAGFTQEMGVEAHASPDDQATIDGRILRNGDDWFAYGLDSPNRRYLGALLLGAQQPGAIGGHATSPLLDDLVGTALGDLGSLLLQVGGEDPAPVTERLDRAPLPPEMRSRGSGCVSVKIRVGEIEIPCFLSSRAASRHRACRAEPQTAEFAPLIEALSRQRTSAQATLGTVDIRFEELMTLGIGDVVKLGKAIEEPLEFHIQDCPVILSGYLCRRHDRLAIRLARPSD